MLALGAVALLSSAAASAWAVAVGDRVALTSAVSTAPYAASWSRELAEALELLPLLDDANHANAGLRARRARALMESLPDFRFGWLTLSRVDVAADDATLRLRAAQRALHLSQAAGDAGTACVAQYNAGLALRDDGDAAAAEDELRSAAAACAACDGALASTFYAAAAATEASALAHARGDNAAAAVLLATAGAADLAYAPALLHRGARALGDGDAMAAWAAFAAVASAGSAGGSLGGKGGDGRDDLIAVSNLAALWLFHPNGGALASGSGGATGGDAIVDGEFVRRRLATTAVLGVAAVKAALGHYASQQGDWRRTAAIAAAGARYVRPLALWLAAARRDADWEAVEDAEDAALAAAIACVEATWWIGDASTALDGTAPPALMSAARACGAAASGAWSPFLFVHVGTSMRAPWSAAHAAAAAAMALRSIRQPAARGDGIDGPSLANRHTSPFPSQPRARQPRVPPLRLAVASFDFRAHALGYLLEGWAAHCAGCGVADGVVDAGLACCTAPSVSPVVGVASHGKFRDGGRPPQPAIELTIVQYGPVDAGSAVRATPVDTAAVGSGSPSGVLRLVYSGTVEGTAEASAAAPRCDNSGSSRNYTVTATFARLAAGGFFLVPPAAADASVVGLLRRVVRPHVLVDTTGHFTGARYGVLAARPASLAVSHMYPGTTGLPPGTVDYFVTDAVVTPVEGTRDVTEGWHTRSESRDDRTTTHVAIVARARSVSSGTGGRAPRALRPTFSESLLVLPGTYQPNAYGSGVDRRLHELRAAWGRRTPAEGTARSSVPCAGRCSGAACRLKSPSSGHSGAAEPLVLACFNSVDKLDPRQWDVWMAVLRARPGATLTLLGGSLMAQSLGNSSDGGGSAAGLAARLRSVAAAHGVSPSRLVFVQPLPRGAHMLRLATGRGVGPAGRPLRARNGVDLALDPRVYGGHTTTSDALWAGVPVATSEGALLPSRVASSFLQARGTGTGGEARCVPALAPLLASHSLTAAEEGILAVTASRPRLRALQRRVRAVAAAAAAAPAPPSTTACLHGDGADAPEVSRSDCSGVRSDDITCRPRNVASGGHLDAGATSGDLRHAYRAAWEARRLTRGGGRPPHVVVTRDGPPS